MSARLFEMMTTSILPKRYQILLAPTYKLTTLAIVVDYELHVTLQIEQQVTHVRLLLFVFCSSVEKTAMPREVKPVAREAASGTR